MNHNPTPSLSTDQSKKTGIVLNRMYTGSYLSSNLGHEVINMFQADDKNYYLYLNAKGNFAAEGMEVGTMLLVRGLGNESIEVVGMAKNLQRVNSAKCTLSRDLGVINQKVRDEQNKFLEKIKYGDVPILKIFGEGGQQSIYISYWVRENDFFTPKEGVRIIIEFPPQKKKNEEVRAFNERLEAYKKIERNEVKKEDGNTTIIIRLMDHNFASTSLHQYILENKNLDLTHLSDVCNAKDKDDEEKLLYWESKDRRINSSEECDRREVSLFDICQIQNDENKFSNALSYFMMKYKKLWEKFLDEHLGEEWIKIVSVTREEDAKVDKDLWKGVTGGRVDLLIRTQNSYIIIENKIGSSIIRDKIEKEDGTKVEITQLERYYNYVEYLKFEEVKKIVDEIGKLETESKKIKDKLKGQMIKYWREYWNVKNSELEDRIKKLREEAEKIKKLKILGCVLSPNYNKPEGELREIKIRPELDVDWYKINRDIIPTFKCLSYGEMYNWISTNAKTLLERGKKYDADFRAFYDAMKKHKYDYENLALFEDMKNTFFTRIKDITDENA